MLGKAAVFVFIFFISIQTDGAEVCGPRSTLKNETIMSLHVINAGQADVMALSCKDGSIGMVVDSGDRRDISAFKRIRDYLLELKGKSPDGSGVGLFLVTHADADHIGGAVWILDNFKVGVFMDNGIPATSKMYMNLRAKALELNDKKQIRYIHAGSQNRFDVCPGVSAEVVTPKTWFKSCKGANNCSIVIKVKAGDVSFLLTGDAERAEENTLEADADEHAASILKSSVLKAGHHGSSSSTGASFLSAVSPGCAVISSGKPGEGENKRYNHPRLEVVNRLLESVKMTRPDKAAIEAYDPKEKAFFDITHSRCLFSTASDGNVIFSTDGKTLACDSKNPIVP